ncbi:MAG TPA: hypothetical protein VK324_10370 [Tepidisphaeraceae bacterium]|nr:hypothetical protein [Tepidisphaeraceae bacterium]
MIHTSLFASPLLALALVAGCAGSGSKQQQQDPRLAAERAVTFQPTIDQTQMAAYAAQTRYPTNASARSDLAVTAEVDSQTGQITIRNWTDRLIRGPHLWVNRTYVVRLNDIPAASRMIVAPQYLYNTGGRNLAGETPRAIQNLQLETEDNLINVKGPQFQ